MDVPAPTPETVTAARAHLTERYACGVDRLLWETEKHPLHDLSAIGAVLDAARSGQAEALDVGAALVLAQAARLDLDRMEFETFEAAHENGMTREAIAAVLDLPGGEAAAARHTWLASQHTMPRAEVEPVRPGRSAAAAEAAERAGRRARQAAKRAEEAARRRQRAGQSGSSRTDADQASARAEEARILAGEAAGRLTLRLLQAAGAHERTAADHEERADSDPAHREELRRNADEYRRAAAAYRRLAESYGNANDPQA